tara:strand:- start:582 stop:1244 length:663 start_codon:yes stop_codon:yes gene_type:complete
MNTKLKIARRDKGLTQIQLSQKLKELGRKVSPQQISNWEKGRYFPSHRNLSAICQILEVNLVEHSIVQNLNSDGNAGDTTEKLANEFSMVEKKKGAISAGPGLPSTDQIDFQLAFRNDWLEKYGGVNQLVVMQVEGDSMTPELKERDVVLINKNIKEVSLGGGIYAIKWKGNILVKRLQVNPQAATVLIKSDNPSYETLETNLDDIEIEGKIIWYGREIR